MGSDLWAAVTSSGFQRAALTTVWLTLVAQAAGTLGGILLAPLRMSGKRIPEAVASLYLLIFRGTPELLQLIAWYAVLPLAGLNLNLVEVAIVGLGANEAARMTEIIRAAIEAVDSGQRDAARVVGLSRFVTLRYVIFPQAASPLLSAIGNEVNIMFKTTSLVSVIGITELLRQGQLDAGTARSPLGIYVAALLYYLVLTSVWGFVQGLLSRRAEVDASKPRVLSAWWAALGGDLQRGVRWNR